MRASSTWTLLQYLTLISRNPLPSPPSHAPSPREMPLALCANAPNTLAGTLFIPTPSTSSPASPALPGPPSISTIWCAPHSKTYVQITPSTPLVPLTSDTVPNLEATLSATSAAILAHLGKSGDGTMPATPEGVVFDSLSAQGVRFEAQNWSNAQLTWGVLGAAVGALADWVADTETEARAGVQTGAVGFVVVDGVNRVGSGVVVCRPDVGVGV